MSWDRGPVAKALAAAIEAELVTAGTSATVHERPPFTLNAPSIVIGRPSEVIYGIAGFGVDEVTLPIGCAHGPDQDDAVSELIGIVRSALKVDPSLGHVVGTAYVSGERAWRNVKTGGGVDLLVAEAIVKVIM